MKKSLFPIVAAALVMTSCSSAYKVGQTPDDVYYSHGPMQGAPKEEKETEEESVYKSYWDGADDSYLRMKVQDRDKWSQIDDINYWYGFNMGVNMYNSPYYPYSYNTWNMGWGMTWGNINPWYNPFYFNTYYNSWNNPMCWYRPVVVVNKFPTAPNRPSLNTSGYRNYNFDRGGSGIFNTGKSSTYGASKSSSDLFRSIFRTPSTSSSGGYSGSSSGSSWDRPARSLGSGSSSSSGSSSGSTMSSGSSGGSSSRSTGTGGGRRGN